VSIDDDTLMAYLDNELPADERARVETALAVDQDLRQRLHVQEVVRDALRAAFGPAVNQRVPDRLEQTALTAPVSWRWRLQKWLTQPANDRATPTYLRFAGSTALLLVGAILGWSVANFPLRTTGDATEPTIAQGSLERALETQLAAEIPSEGPRVGVSFKSTTGNLCRTFDVGASQQNKAGIACRGANGWAIETLVAAEPRAPGPYETVASTMPATVRDALSTMIDGTPFDATQEQAARDRGWRP